VGHAATEVDGRDLEPEETDERIAVVVTKADVDDGNLELEETGEGLAFEVVEAAFGRCSH
jgi:hypothetical protein